MQKNNRPFRYKPPSNRVQNVGLMSKPQAAQNLQKASEKLNCTQVQAQLKRFIKYFINQSLPLRNGGINTTSIKPSYMSLNPSDGGNTILAGIFTTVRPTTPSGTVYEKNIDYYILKQGATTYYITIQ